MVSVRTKEGEKLPCGTLRFYGDRFGKHVAANIDWLCTLLETRVTRDKPGDLQNIIQELQSEHLDNLERLYDYQAQDYLLEATDMRLARVLQEFYVIQKLHNRQCFFLLLQPSFNYLQ